MQRVKRGDTVEVIAGKDKGFRGEVMRVLTRESRVVVNEINIMKKHQPARQGPGGQQLPAEITNFEAPLDLSNVMPVCPQCDQKTRVGYEVRDGFKTRICKKCGEAMD